MLYSQRVTARLQELDSYVKGILNEQVMKQ